jgi:hypothetical protein
LTTEQTNINCATIIFKQLDDARDSYLLTGHNARPQPQHCSVSMSQQQWPSGPPS